MANQNLELLKVAGKLLEPALDELVFVGGCATGLLVSHEAAAELGAHVSNTKRCKDRKSTTLEKAEVGSPGSAVNYRALDLPVG
jgi:hypothetical protein